MKVYRYNTERNNRAFNNTGEEKNPNMVKFYATNLDYVEKYNSTDFDCTLEVSEVSTENLFDMANDFKTLNTYNKYIANEIGSQMRDYTRFMNEAKKVKERKMWANQIEQLKERENELISFLISTEFQSLSDFQLQNDLVAELTSKGYNGYITKNEVAIF